MGDNFPIASSLVNPGPISTVPSALIAICTFPANAVPCTNKATTYSSSTLATPCSTSIQIVLAGTSTCVGTTDNRGNWGAWVSPANYDFTVTVSTGQSFGPFTISAGNFVAGTATNLTGPGAINGTFSGNPTLTGTWTFNILPVFPSQAQNTFFAAGCGGAGVPAFRIICTADVPAISLTVGGNGGTTSSGTTAGHLATWTAGGFLQDGGVPAGGGVTSVGLALPSQYTVTNSPVTGTGTLTGAWNNQNANTVLGGPSSSGIGGVLDGFVTGTSTAATTLPLSLKPNTTTDLAFFHVSSSFIGQPGPVSISGTGVWTTEVANGNVGGLFRQPLSTSTLLTATANLTNATNFAGAMFFLQTTGAPAFPQNKNTSGGIVNGATLQFTGNTVIGNAILVTLDGTPPSTAAITANIVDTQGNAFTPIAYAQNGSSSVAMSWLATNIKAATTDTITYLTTSGSVTSGNFHMVEISGIAVQAFPGQPSFQILTPGHVRTFLQAATTTTTTCPTAAAAGSICTYTLTWPLPWPDTTYVPSCMGTGTITGFPVIQGVGSAGGPTLTTTQVVVTVENGTANEAVVSGYTDMRCIGMSTK